MQKQRRKLVLGSSSPWRQRRLREAGYDFDVISPGIDEKAIRDPDPVRLVRAIAQAKMMDLLVPLDGRDAFLITADQVAVFDGEILEKPVDRDQARAYLRRYRGRTLTLYTAVMVIDLKTRLWSDGVDVCTVEIGELPDEAIEQAILRGAVLQSCGAFVFDDSALAPFVRIASGSVSSCEGMPLELLASLLARYGYRRRRRSQSARTAS